MSVARDFTPLPPILGDADWNLDFLFFGADATAPLAFAGGSTFSLVLAPAGQSKPAPADVHELTSAAGINQPAAHQVGVSHAKAAHATWTPGKYDVELRRFGAGGVTEGLYFGSTFVARGLSQLADLGGGDPANISGGGSVSVFRDPDQVRIVRGEAAGSAASAEASATSASADAAAAHADRVQADADAAATAADRIVVHTDRLQADADATATTADRIVVHADRLQADADAAATAADRIVVHADRLQADADAAATAADRIVVRADRVQADADAAATAADRIVVHADRLQADADATATAADRVQTGLDRTAADGSSTTASNAAAAVLGSAVNAAAALVAMAPLKIVATTYTITDADNGKLLAFTAATRVIIYVDTLAAGFVCGILKGGAGDVEVRPGLAGVAAPAALLTLNTQYATAILRQVFDAVHVLQGGQANLPNLGLNRFLFNQAGASGLISALLT